MTNKFNPPSWLSKESKDNFKKLAEIIEITRENLDLVAILADLINNYKRCEITLRDEGICTEYNGNIKQHPSVGSQQKYATLIKQYFDKLIPEASGGEMESIV